MRTENFNDAVFTQKIRNRLFKQFLISLSLVLLVIGLFLNYSSYSIVKTMVFQKAIVKTQLAYELLSHWVDEDSLAIKSVADYLSFGDMSSAKILDFLEFENNNFQLNPPFIAYENGDFISGGGWVPHEGYIATERPWYVASKNFFSHKQNLNTVYYSMPYLSIDTDKIVVTMSAPILKADKITGYVGVDVEIDEIENLISTIDDIKGSWFLVTDEGYILVSGSNSSLVGREVLSTQIGVVYNDFLEVEQDEGLSVTKIKNDSDNYFFIRDPATKWVIFFKINDEIVTERVRILSFGLLGGALLLLAIFAVIISVVASNFTRPIVTLARSAEKIAGGDFDCKIESKLRDELGYLTYQFNYMAKGLEEREVFEKNQARIDTEMLAGQNIQMSILPKKLLDNPHFSSYAFYSSAREVGGDFYDYFKINDECVVFCIGDVSGKGVPAAMFMTMVCTLIRAICPRVDKPSDALRELNNIIAANNTESMFATVCLVYYNPISGEASFSSGGHNPIYLLQSADVKEVANVGGMLIGVFDGAEYKCGAFKVEKGDTAVLYTDGITEAHSQNSELYGDERLKLAISENSKKNVEDIGKEIISSVDEFQKGEQFDDITLLLWSRT